MKYLVMLCDGMADYPVDELGGKTPLEAAATPNMDKLAETASVGLVKTVADGLKPGSDVQTFLFSDIIPTTAIQGVLRWKQEALELI